jgi:NDP-4-keto-2,6-dideoxyhexose 3-C-methyltransferase
MCSENVMSRQFATPTKDCRLCHSRHLDKVLSLGNQYVSDFVASDGSSPQVPLELVRCQNCGLVQLKDTFSRASLYHHYWYKSGISSTMREALADLAKKTAQVANAQSGDIVVDIGCNDGTLLRSYPIDGLRLVGFEPAENLVGEARRGTDWIFNDFFTAEAFKKKFGDRKANVVTSIAMFYDLEDPNHFVSDASAILDSNGVWTVQQNYLGSMLERNGFDNIGHEHLEYYSLTTMQELMKRHDLEVFDVETNDVNGGSFRTFIGHKGKHGIRTSVVRLHEHEKRVGLDRHATFEEFARRIEKLRDALHEFVADEVKNGKVVYVYGASNRGNTILQYCRLDHTLIRKAADANPEKWGRKTVGTLIPIVSKEEARRDNPDYFLILPHHFLREILHDESEYLKSGGKFIVPLPEFQVVTGDSKIIRHVDS